MTNLCAVNFCQEEAPLSPARTSKTEITSVKTNAQKTREKKNKKHAGGSQAARRGVGSVVAKITALMISAAFLFSAALGQGIVQGNPPLAQKEEIGEAVEVEATGGRLKVMFESAQDKEAGERIGEQTHAASTARRTQELCAFCPEGMSAEPNTLIPDDEGGLTCGQAEDAAATATIPKSDLCLQAKLAQGFCCPASAALYHPHSCRDSARQEKVTVSISKIPAAFSILGSSFILYWVGRKWRTNKKSVDPYQRIMVMYSVTDILYTFFFWFLDTWMAPVETGWWMAAGNTHTCNAQGFFQNFLIGCALYQCALSLQMLMLVTFSWTSKKFHRVLERKIHICIVTVTLVYAAVPLFFQGYNPQCSSCHTVPLPMWCDDVIHECARGSRTLTTAYDTITSCTILIAILFCTGCMITIYGSVYRQENKSARYSVTGQLRENHAQSKRIRKTMLLYTGSFYICWVLPTILWHFQIVGIASSTIGDVLFPLMGLFNMLCFIQPTCIKYQKQHPGTNLVICYFFVLFNRPIAFVKLISNRYTSTTGPANADDGIGFQTYNEGLAAPRHPPEGPIDGPVVSDEAGGSLAVADGFEDKSSTTACNRDRAIDTDAADPNASPALTHADKVLSNNTDAATLN